MVFKLIHHIELEVAESPFHIILYTIKNNLVHDINQEPIVIQKINFQKCIFFHLQLSPVPEPKHRPHKGC